MSKKTYKYPVWLSDYNFTWMKLDPSFREYFLRRAGYDMDEDAKALPDVPESEATVVDWMYGKQLDSHFWCAKGFQQARSVATERDNLAMNNDASYFSLIAWAAKRLYEEGVDKKWWNETITNDQFVDEHNHEWARSL